MNMLGTLVLWITFGLALIAFLLLVFIRKTDTRKHPGILLGLVACSGVLLSAALLVISLIRGIFSVEFVYHNTESSLPLIYKISAFWSGSAGSMLLWTSFFAVLLIFIYAKRKDEPETKTVFGVVLLFIILFMVMISFINNPFHAVTPKTDGFGLNPALQTVGMVFHPPIVILGFAFFFIALAYSYHDLREQGQAHQDAIRNWTLWGWVLLTGGIISGGLWAYTELGWGGYWAWDPIENSSLVNWLLATAFLHTLGGGVKNKTKNFILITLTVFSVLIGTFIARSGILKSVHAYNSQEILTFLGIALILLAILTVFMYFRNRQKNPVAGSDDAVTVNGTIPRWFQKALQPVNLLPNLLMVMAVLIFGGTVFPLIGKETPMDFYNYSFAILGLVLLLVIGICPILFSGKKSSLIPGAVVGIVLLGILLFTADYDLLTKITLAVCAMLILNLLLRLIPNFKYVFTNRKQLSFVVLHVSIIVIALGVAGSKGITYGMEQMFEYGAVKSVKGYTVRYRNLQWRYEKGKTVAIATLRIQGPKDRLTLKPELTYYQKMDMNHSRAVIKAGFWEDLYIIFEGLDEQNRALFKVMVLRWASMVWIGGILLIIGTLLRFGVKDEAIAEGQGGHYSLEA
jgi:cytochrome c-type biogenesis protein CcmF